MKIQQLHIHNIASIEDALIDFTAPPLADSDVFLITGDTGAGKTTLLDAICLALFNTTPRLSKGKGTKVRNGIDDLTLKDPRRLMRRNTGEATILLSFEANGTNYAAEWHVQRGKNKKVNVGLDNISRKFTNRSTNQSVSGIGAKDTELQEAIEKVIGLDFPQFCRTTMLAQNEFTKFLASDEDDRAAILEKITKTAAFSAVGAKVYEITFQKRKDWEAAQDAARDTCLTEQEKSDKKAQIEHLGLAMKQQQEARDMAAKKRDWLKREQELLAAEQQAEKASLAAQQLLESEDYQQALLFAAQWNTSLGVRQTLKDGLEAEKTIREQNENLLRVRSKILAVLAGQQFNREETNRLEKELEQIHQYLEANSGKATTFENAQTIIGYLNTILNRLDKFNRLKEEVNSEQKTHDERLLPARERAKQLFETEAAQRTALAEEIASKQKTLSAMQLPELRKACEGLRDLLRDIREALQDAAAIQQAEENRRQEANRLADEAKKIDADQKQLNETLLPQYNMAKLEKEAAEQACDLMHTSVEQFAKQMRSRLSVGCECPVCRQTIRSLPLEKDIDELYQKAVSSAEAKKQAFQQAEARKNAAESQLQIRRDNYNRARQDLDNDNTVGLAREKAAASSRKCGIEEGSDKCMPLLLQLQKEKQTRLTEQLEPHVREGERLDNELKALQLRLEELNKAYDAAREEYDKARQAVADSETAIAAHLTTLNETRKEGAAARAAVQPLIAVAEWTTDWTLAPEHFRDELKAAAEIYQAILLRKGEIERELGPRQNANDSVQHIISDICREQTDWALLTALEVRQDTHLFASANEVQQAVNRIHTLLRDAEKKQKDSASALDLFLQQHPDFTRERLQELSRSADITPLTNKLETHRRESGEKKVLWENACAEHRQHQSGQPTLAEEDTYARCCQAYDDADREKTQLSNQKALLEAELRADDQKKAGLRALMEAETAARQQFEKWNHLNALIGDKEGKTFRTIAQSYLFGGLLHAANEYLQKLEPRYTLKTIPGTLISSLEDAYQGFASRDTSSLSGGESFLVSLALALALSDLGQGLSVDTLFIDEGFGSLSGQPLANAIRTLRSLRGKNGRHVGIISHIQEVRDNIPVQIQVNKAPGSSSSTIQTL